MGAAFSYAATRDQNLETYSLIWLDQTVDNNENVQAQKELRSVINHLVIFKHEETCLKYIHSVPIDDRIIFIVSGTMDQNTVPKIIHLRQITSIYVYCSNIKLHLEWTKSIPRVKGVFNELNKIIDHIRSDRNERQTSQIDESLSINILKSRSNPLNTGSTYMRSNQPYIEVSRNQRANDKEQSSCDLNGEFLHSQLLIDCLIRMKPDDIDKKVLLNLCESFYDKNKFELQIIKKFRKKYSSEKAIRWYTRQSFLYRLLNKALRVQNIDLLYLLRFFIHDMEEQLEKHKCLQPVRVYRCQIMSSNEVQMLSKSQGEIISMNSFLSTSLTSEKAREFLPTEDIPSQTETEKVLFEIYADPQIENIKPFSNISSLSYYPAEEEILFMAGSTFRLEQITKGDDGVWTIRMTLCSSNDHQIQTLFQYMKTDASAGETNLLRFGKILTNMGKVEDAERYIRYLLDQRSKNDQDKSLCYSQLGVIACIKGDYVSSLSYLDKSLEIDHRTEKSNGLTIAANHSNKAMVYEKQGDYVLALESYMEAFGLYRKAYGENHAEVAICLNNIGIVYMRQNKYREALGYYEEALTIREQCGLPSNHLHLGDSHLSIGGVRCHLHEYDQALEHFKKAHKIYIESLPSQHPDMALVLEHIAYTYQMKNDLNQAIAYYKDAENIYRHSFNSTHPDLVKIEEHIRHITNPL